MTSQIEYLNAAERLVTLIVKVANVELAPGGNHPYLESSYFGREIDLSTVRIGGNMLLSGNDDTDRLLRFLNVVESLDTTLGAGTAKCYINHDGGFSLRLRPDRIANAQYALADQLKISATRPAGGGEVRNRASCAPA